VNTTSNCQVKLTHETTGFTWSQSLQLGGFHFEFWCLTSITYTQKLNWFFIMAALGFELTILSLICTEAMYLLSQMVLLTHDAQDQIATIIMSFLKYSEESKTPFEVESEH
jgi:hypothetical protein